MLSGLSVDCDKMDDNTIPYVILYFSGAGHLTGEVQIFQGGCAIKELTEHCSSSTTVVGYDLQGVSKKTEQT